jgi:recombination protein RecA
MARKSASTTATHATDAAYADALGSFLSEMDKDRPGEVRRLDDERSLDVEVYSTGAISLDVALGIGGLPRGRIVEIFGSPGSGKTTVALATAVNCQRAGGVIGFVDCEHALSRDLAIAMGIDPSRFVVYQPKDGEDAVEMIEKMLRSQAFAMVVVDSVAAMTPRAEMEAEVAQHGMAHHARLMSKFIRRITGLVGDTNTLLVCCNQTRKNLGAYIVQDVPTGGSSLPFASSVRIECRTSNSKRIERKGELVGTTVTATVVKNKLASPFKKAEYDVIFGHGIEAGGALLAVAEQLGLVNRAGASYTEVATGERFAIGKEAAKSELAANAELAERLTAAVYSTLMRRNSGDELAAAGFDEDGYGDPLGDVPTGDPAGETGDGQFAGTVDGLAATA